MQDLNPDLTLSVIQYLNVVDSGRLAACSQRYYYLVHQYRKLRGPELVTISSWDPSSFHQKPAEFVASQHLSKLQKPPNLVLAFNTPRSAVEDFLPRYLPGGAATSVDGPTTTILGACAQSIQVNLGKDNVECKSNASVMYASFPDAQVLPFQLEYGPKLKEDLDALKQKLVAESTAAGTKEHWKAIIVYACGSGSALLETFVSSLQALLPQVAIVGGVCGQGYLSRAPLTLEELRGKSVRELRTLASKFGGASGFSFVEKSELVDHVYNLQKLSSSPSSSADTDESAKEEKEESSSKDSVPRLSMDTMEDGIFGVVLGGDAPVRSMVSRGVTSVTHGIPQNHSPYVVQECALTRPEDPDFLFRGNDLQAIHMIKKIYHKENVVSMTAMELMGSTNNVAEFIGIKRKNEDGFELHMLSRYCQMVEAYLVMTDGSEAQMESLEDAEIDFFSLNGEACCEDMTRKVNRLKEQTKGEEILGAVMFSCNGRGPRAGGLIREEMSDAKRFAKGFPNVPCLGFYAGGEVGPLALAGNENVFQTGKASVQGFTAVFCLFIVPVVERRKYQLDDCLSNVETFVRSRLT